jgi:hypothetical protein
LTITVTGAAGGAHRLDHVVDEPLDLGRGELLARDLAGALAQDGIADRDDGQDGHQPSRIGIRTPRSSATSTARG